MLDVRYGNMLDSPHLVMENPLSNVNPKHKFTKYVPLHCYSKTYATNLTPLDYKSKTEVTIYIRVVSMLVSNSSKRTKNTFSLKC